MNRRRTVFALLAIGAVPLAALAQAALKIHRIAVLSIGTDPANPVRWQPLFETLGRLGYEEGRNLRVARFFGDGKAERLPGQVAELIAAKVDVVVTTGDREVIALRQAGIAVPIIFTFVADPIERGFVASLARPGGNITGFSSLVPGLGQKYVELLREVVPSAKRFVVVATSSNTRPQAMLDYDAAARAFAMSVTAANVTDRDSYGGVLARAKQSGAAAIIAPMDGETFRFRNDLVELALKHRLPGIYGDEAYVEAGGLMSYSSSFADRLRRAAGHVDRILRGAKPDDLPVEQPVVFDLVVNLRTARTLGLTIPQSVLIRATRVIE
jgi:putative tryptophan/tyrosine transport system substrate-binding protein